jgi:peptidoglycan hydrolase-like protein with peptidoglycan-binding domain
MLPHSWSSELTAGKGDPQDVLALQSALLLDGVYPGAGKTKNDCPRSGRIGPCTLEALGTFQKKYGIVGETNIVGEKTRSILNSKYSVGRL